MKTPLTERRKADRTEMAAQVRKLVIDLGATVTDEDPFHPHQIRLEIAHPGGARIGLDFDGQSCQPDTHVACWNVASDSPACFSDWFGDVNRYHFRKSQFVARGFDALLTRLRSDLECLNDGSGYDAKRAATVGVECVGRFAAMRAFVADKACNPV